MTKKYSAEFKAQGVARVQEGETFKAVSKACGCSVYSLRDWVKRAEVEALERPPTREEHAEIRRLKRALREAEEAREILEKATAYFGCVSREVRLDRGACVALQRARDVQSAAGQPRRVLRLAGPSAAYSGQTC
jgi:transposase